jgi:hypothetical protein
MGDYCSFSHYDCMIIYLPPQKERELEAQRIAHFY